MLKTEVEMWFFDLSAAPIDLLIGHLLIIAWSLQKRNPFNNLINVTQYKLQLRDNVQFLQVSQLYLVLRDTFVNCRIEFINEIPLLKLLWLKRKMQCCTSE
jgi:hypothetical protein